jgi:hypothetical protein
MSYTFFGVQIAITAFHRDPLRRNLHDAIAHSPSEQSLADKRTFWKTIAALLNESMPVFELGFWDLISGDKAEQEFETWTSELEGSLATQQEEMGSAPDEANRLSSDKRYVLVTCLFLVAAGTASETTLRERCDLPKSDWWQRQTFSRLIATFPMLNFGNVRADAIYLSPGSDHDGLSTHDLHGEGYEYLRQLE